MRKFVHELLLLYQVVEKEQVSPHEVVSLELAFDKQGVSTNVILELRQGKLQ